MKFADVTPAHKKGDCTDKSNYRPVSVLPGLSKIFEKLLFTQINNFMDNKLVCIYNEQKYEIGRRN